MSDVRESQATTYQEAMSVARQIGAVSYIETSAKISYTSTTSAFEAAALTTIPSLVRQPSSVISSRTSVQYKRGNSLPAGARAEHLNKISTLEKQQTSSTLTSAKKLFSLSNGSLHSKSSTLSSNKSNSSVLSISTGKTPILGRRNARKVQEAEAEKLVKIKVERLTRDKQVEEVEIEIPVSVYNNMHSNEESDFVRNSGKRKSLACKLKNLILR